jgi:hypothetical protein
MKAHGTRQLLFIRVQLLILISMTLFVLLPASRAAVFGPYTVDDGTLHLWHFDETSGAPYVTNNGTSSGQFGTVTNGVFFDAVTSNPQTSSLIFTNAPGLVNQPNFTGFPPNNFALQGQPAWVGSNSTSVVSFGYSDMTTNFSCTLPPFNWPNPLATATTWAGWTNLSDYINTNTGAFTFEAMIRPVVNPLTAGRNMEIIAGDSGFAFRAWQFRISSAGKLEFNMNINAPAAWVHDVLVPLPATGRDAVVAGNWYHVAVTCTGNAPTNGDATAQVKLYWTLMDMTRTNADVLLVTNVTYGTFTNTAVPLMAIGGSGRGSPISNVGNSEGFIGNIDEVRISSVCRKSTEMLFDTNVAFVPIGINIPQTNYLVAYGQTLQIIATETGTQPMTNQWYQNGVALPGQTNAALIISNVTFAANGNYQLWATNAAGSAAGVVCAVNVGAAFNGVFNTGVDANGNTLFATAPGSADLHYLLTQSADPNNPGPNAIVWGGVPNGGAPSSLVSGWIGPRNGNGAPGGVYAYQTKFQIDNADLASSVLSGNMMAGGTSANIVQAFLNGVETDITLAPNTVSTFAPFVITNGLQAGSNTLSFTLTDTSGNFPGLFRVELTGIGSALPPGLPTFNNQPPDSQTVPYGTAVVLPVVALGRPPLSYQWLSNGVPLSSSFNSSATNQYLAFVATNIDLSHLVGSSFTADYQVVVSNDAGSVTSSVTALTITIPPLTVASAGVPIWSPTNSQTNIVVIFSATVDPVTAATAGNYSLDNGASVLSATIGDAPNKVILTTSLLTPGIAYNLTVQNVEDSFGVTMSPSPSSPIAVGVYPTTVALWIRADTGVTTNLDGTVSQWNDLSGNGNNLTGGASEPILAADAINGRPVVRFAAANGTYMIANTSPSLAITGDMTILAVVNFVSVGGTTNGMIVSKVNGNNQPAPYDYYVNSSVRLLRGNGSSSAGVNSTKAPSFGVQHFFDVTMKGTNVTHRLDGLPNGGGTLSTATTDTGHPLSIGMREDSINRLTGDMAELIIVGSALTTNDVASIEGYFTNEYNLQIAPIINPNPTNILFSLSGNQLMLSWPADHTGWLLQSNALGLTTTSAWFTIPGSSATDQMTFTPDATQTNVFFRMLYQP